MRDLSVPNEELHLPAYILFQAVYFYALFAKHRGFSEEREWRVAYLKDRDTGQSLASMFDYAIGPNGVEPKLKLDIKPIPGLTGEDLSLSTFIERIILGPSAATPLAKAAIERMVDKLLMPELKSRLIASSIPYRETR